MAEPKKVVYGVGVHNDKCKRKVMKAISSLEGIQSIDMNMKDKKLTIVGIVNPVCGYKKLTKVCHAEILTVGPAKSEKVETKTTKVEPKPAKCLEVPISQCRPCTSHGYYVITEGNPNPCVIL